MPLVRCVLSLAPAADAFKKQFIERETEKCVQSMFARHFSAHPATDTTFDGGTDVKSGPA